VPPEAPSRRASQQSLSPPTPPQPPAAPTLAPRRISVNPALLQQASAAARPPAPPDDYGGRSPPPPPAPSRDAASPPGILCRSPPGGKRKSVKIDLAENTVAFIDNNSTNVVQPTPRRRSSVNEDSVSSAADQGQAGYGGSSPPVVMGRPRAQQGAQGYVSADTRVTGENRESLSGRDSLTGPPSPLTYQPQFQPMAIPDPAAGASRRQSVGSPPPLPPPPPPRRASVALSTPPQPGPAGGGGGGGMDSPPPLPPSATRRASTTPQLPPDTPNGFHSPGNGSSSAAGDPGADLRDMGGATSRRLSAVGGSNPMAARRANNPKPRVLVSPQAGEGEGEGSGSGSDGEGANGGGGGEGDEAGGPPPLPLAQRIQPRTKGTGKVVGRRMSSRGKG